MFARLLVATDFSRPSDAALEYARILARAFGAHLYILHVMPNVFLRPVVGDPRALEDAMRARLRDRFTSEDHRLLHVTTAVQRSDEPAEEILSYARRHRIDLIAIGARARGRMGRVAEKAVRAARCPVLTVHAASLGHASGFQRIMVPSSFSTPPQEVLEYARLVGLRFGAPVHPLRVPVDTARSIVRHAADDGFDLIVMGTYGRTGIAHLVTRSVAEQVICGTTCPVLTVRLPHGNDLHARSRAEAVGATA